MLPLAHLGIGQRLANVGNRLPLKPVLLGTLFPDLIDKPLYYVPAFLTGKYGAELGLISGTRSVAHSLAFLCALLLVAVIAGRQRQWWLALSAGVASHLFLDNFLEPWSPLTPYSSRIALLFPNYGMQFPIAIHHSFGEHIFLHLNPLELVAELVGAVLLILLWRRAKTRLAPADRAIQRP
jgi:membrane-bound metal-dependent hydrolase YbcI (DUF457 family)